MLFWVYNVILGESGYSLCFLGEYVFEAGANSGRLCFVELIFYFTSATAPGFLLLLSSSSSGEFLLSTDFLGPGCFLRLTLSGPMLSSFCLCQRLRFMLVLAFFVTRVFILFFF